jgi:hypothetical protein
MRAARLAGLVARQRPRALRRSLLAAQIAQASHAAAQLGRNILMSPRDSCLARPSDEQYQSTRCSGRVLAKHLELGLQ